MENYAVISHVGVFVYDLPKVMDFYTRVLGFVVTDNDFPNAVFLSRNPTHHHQIALFVGRKSDLQISQVQQISFKVASVEEVRRLYRRIAKEGMGRKILTTSHGNTWSVYFHDPEGNRLEFFTDTPWYVPQPCADPIDLTQSAEELYRSTEERNRLKPGVLPVQEWSAKFERNLAQRLADINAAEE